MLQQGSAGCGQPVGCDHRHPHQQRARPRRHLGHRDPVAGAHWRHRGGASRAADHTFAFCARVAQVRDDLAILFNSP
jgi:hypothetical protein